MLPVYYTYAHPFLKTLQKIHLKVLEVKENLKDGRILNDEDQNDECLQIILMIKQMRCLILKIIIKN